MSRFRNTTPFTPARTNALAAPFVSSPTNHLAPFTPALRNALLDVRPKTEWMPGHYRQLPFSLGYRLEWIAGYWRRVG